MVPIGDSLLLIPALAGIGLFSFAMHQIIQAAVLDIVGTGSEAKSLGLLFGIHGMVGVASPFVASVIIDHMGGYGSIFYYSAILTGITAGLVALLPIRERPRIK